MSASPDSGSPVLNRCKNITKGRLNFELVVQCNRYQQVTYSKNLVCLISESTIINVLTYQWQDQVSNTHSHHKSIKAGSVCISRIYASEVPKSHETLFEYENYPVTVKTTYFVQPGNE